MKAIMLEDSEVVNGTVEFDVNSGVGVVSVGFEVLSFSTLIFGAGVVVLVFVVSVSVGKSLLL